MPDNDYPPVGSNDWPISVDYRDGDQSFWLIVQPEHLGGAILGKIALDRSDGTARFSALAADGARLDGPFGSHADTVRALLDHAGTAMPDTTTADILVSADRAEAVADALATSGLAYPGAVATHPVGSFRYAGLSGETLRVALEAGAALIPPTSNPS